MPDNQQTHKALTFTEAVSKCFKNCFNFKGRASRSEYWWFFLFIVMVNAVFEILTRIMYPSGLEYNILLVAILIIICLFLAIAQIAVAARRLHDIGKSGWFQLLELIPVVGAIILIVLFCQRSDLGANKYGVLED